MMTYFKKVFMENVPYFAQFLLLLFLMPPVVLGSITLTIHMWSWVPGVCEMKR